MSLRAPLAKVKGLGASGEGSHHWWLQRMSALALIPLSFWFVFSMINHIGDSHESAIAWVSQPWVALLLVLYLLFLFFHAQLGMQVVIEDYVHSQTAKFIALMVVKGLTVVAGLAAVFAVLRLAL